MKKIYILLLLISSILFSKSINEQIKTLKHLSPSKRISMMNKIKKQLFLMNQQERVKTINLLRKKIRPNDKNIPIPKQPIKLSIQKTLTHKRLSNRNISQIYQHSNLQKDKIKRFIKNRARRK